MYSLSDAFIQSDLQLKIQFKIRAEQLNITSSIVNPAVKLCLYGSQLPAV